MIDLLRSLTMKQRISRFHGAMSDAALEIYVGRLNWNLYWAAGDQQFGRLTSLIELFACPRDDWRSCELAFCMVSRPSRQVLAELIQLAFLAAGRRGAQRIEIWCNQDEDADMCGFIADQLEMSPSSEGCCVIDLLSWFG